jgi:hypothetical protein
MMGNQGPSHMTDIDCGPWGVALERSLTMKKKGKKDEAKGPKKGK